MTGRLRGDMTEEQVRQLVKYMTQQTQQLQQLLAAGSRASQVQAQ